MELSPVNEGYRNYEVTYHTVADFMSSFMKNGQFIEEPKQHLGDFMLIFTYLRKGSSVTK
jgi:hypothetical protein